MRSAEIFEPLGYLSHKFLEILTAEYIDYLVLCAVEISACNLFRPGCLVDSWVCGGNKGILFNNWQVLFNQGYQIRDFGFCSGERGDTLLPEG